MNDLVSIIMPAYNTAEYIEESIESVLKQTYENWELIIVDDCSTDNTKERVSRYSDSRMKIFGNEKNSGAAHSRNRALQLAKGRWIAFLDSDDLWEPHKLEKQIGFMEQNEYSFTYTEYGEMDSDGNATGVTVSGPKHINRRRMFDYCWPGCLTVMYDASKLGLLQINDIRKNNDYAMWLKLCKKADCYLLKENLASYRKGRTNSISTHGYTELVKWHYRLFRICEEESVLMSTLNTVRNVVWGLYKKIKYVKH